VKNCHLPDQATGAIEAVGRFAILTAYKNGIRGALMNKNIDEIQLIRGFCIFIIVVGHMNDNLITWNTPAVHTFYNYFDGTTGLDAFFALSGFVICRLLLNDLGKSESRHHSLQISGVFWLRRIWRLLPAAWLWLALIMIMTIFVNESGAFGSVRDAWGGALSAFLQVANFKLAHCWEERYFCGPSFPYWTLSFEEQFYLFLPLFMIFSGKWFVRAILLLLFTQFFIPALTLPPYFRIQAFLLGILLAVWSRSDSYRIFEPVFLRNNWARRIMLLTLLTLLCVTSYRVIPSYIVYQMSALIGAILVFIASYDANYLWQEGWLKNLGMWLGDRAYAMYLCHIPIFYLTREIAYQTLGPGVKLSPEHFWYLVPGALFLIFLASELTFRLVEKPLRSKGVEISRALKQRQGDERQRLKEEQLKLKTESA
jgi:peptidoglycan/LPS O-acetylase OafA/YrhL